ncbi:hypothetical protein PRZ48_010414 [Zasmidium cellare]|uniref:Uncharacterized protein n=1 Tax=Zasmidium cellare TaxID=395010 RepID=A0ABR0E8L0_ZASCE|nr:hypothetical protein PRZ48_010414 [Zasmidium cellare]
MSALKGLALLGGFASLPLTIAYIFTADHSRMTFGTPAAGSVAKCFSNFDEKAKDWHHSPEEVMEARRRRHALMRGEA